RACVHEADAFCLSEISDAGRVHCLEGPHPSPRIIAWGVASLPSVIECGFQDGQNSVGGGTPPTDGVGSTVVRPIVLFFARAGSSSGRLLGKAVVPILEPLRRQLGDRKGA